MTHVTHDDLADWLDRPSRERELELFHQRLNKTPRCVAEEDVPAGACGHVWYKHHHTTNGGPKRHVCVPQRKGHVKRPFAKGRWAGDRHVCPCGASCRAAPRHRNPTQARLEVIR